MMDNRSILFIVLSTIVLLFFYFLQATHKPAEQALKPSATAITANSTAPTAAPSAAPAASALATAAAPFTSAATAPAAPAQSGEREVSVETPHYKAVFSSKGGTIKSWILTDYKDEAGNPLGILGQGGRIRALALGSQEGYALSEEDFTLSGGDLKMSEGGTGAIVFSLERGAVKIQRTYTFNADRYYFEIEDKVEGLTAYRLTLGDRFGMHTLAVDSYTHTGPVVLVENDREDITLGDLKEGPKEFKGLIKWIANEDKYFCSALVPSDRFEAASAWKVEGEMAPEVRGAGVGTHKHLVYAGPKEHDRLVGIGRGLEYIVDFGFFSIVARPIFWLLKKCYLVTGNYGWAIVLLTTLIRIPFIPIVNMGQRSMKKMQELQPRFAELKERYKKDPERMNKETLELYQKHKINPVSGCLPLLLQIPVFLALYKVLMVAIELRGAPYMYWVQDLSVKDPYYVLPVIMGLTMFLQQKMTPMGGDPLQKKIFMFLPLIFTFMFLSFPSGLVLYWLVNNVLSIAQQYYINKTGESALAKA